ncbi:hypothetical protein OROHE_016418 [Orobanche hederae]
MKAEYFPPKEDVILQNEAPTDFYILVTGAMELLVSKNKVEQVYGEAKTGDLWANVRDGTIFLNNLPQTENMLVRLDSFKFQSKSTEAVVNELGASLLSGLDADESCEPLINLCPNCFGTLDCPTTDGVSTSNFWCKLCCPKCPEENESARLSPALLATQVKRQAEGFISRYYNRMMTCEDETCKYTTRSLNMEVLGDSQRGIICPNYPCFNGRLVTQYTERDLYRLLHLGHCTMHRKGELKNSYGERRGENQACG